MLNEETIKNLDEREAKIREALERDEAGTMTHQRLMEDWERVLLLRQSLEANDIKIEKEKEADKVAALQAEANVTKTCAEASKAKSEGFKAKIEPWLQFCGVILGGVASALAMAYTTERNAQVSESMLEYEKTGVYDMPTVRSVMNGMSSSFVKGGKK